MKDRTLIILAVLFLTFSIGSGVNKSLEAGNRTMGKPMAPDLKSLYNDSVPFLIGQLEELGEISQQRARFAFYERYPAVIGNLDRTKMLVSCEIRTRTELWRGKFEKACGIIKDKVQDKKNMFVR